jgi:hypothetical protein
MFPAGPPNPKLGLNETTLIEVPGAGEVLAMMRCDPESYLYASRSNDDGLTWSQPQKTDIWGVPAHVIALQDHRLLCVYGYRRPPMGIRACLSTDGGTTWDVGHEMILRADARGSVSDVGYPRAVQLPDGKLLAVYYISTDGTNRRVHVAWTRFDVPAPGAATGDGK